MKHSAEVALGDQVAGAIDGGRAAGLQSDHVMEAFARGQLVHLCGLVGGRRQRPFAEEVLAGVQRGHPHLKRHAYADGDQVHVTVIDHLGRIGECERNPEVFGRLVRSFLTTGADRGDLEFGKRLQSRNVGIAALTLAGVCANDPDTDFVSRHDAVSLRERAGAVATS